jgi:predicted N-acetyltransferase YhbS
VSHEPKVRSAGLDDRPAVLRVVQEAFATDDRDGREELDIVEAVWTLEAACSDLELVATIDRMVAGYVLGSWGHLQGRPVIGVAPLAVTPAFQRLGVGSALMKDLVERADGSQLPLLVLLGNPGYYRRFGFESSAPLGIFYEPVGPENPHFQARRFRAYTPAFRGEYRYAWEIGHGK